MPSPSVGSVPVLSVLDQSPVPDGSSAAEALRATVALAQEAERLGYHRYWLAEHHNTASLAGTAPEVLAAQVAASTTSIRVGAGGVLLSHYSPLKVAETFRVLDALHPGRIDLGLGRAGGADPLAAAALGDGAGALPDDRYPEAVSDLLGFLYDGMSEGHRFAGVRAMPDGPGTLEVWVLSSSSYGAALAAGLGLPFCFAHFISPRFGPQVMAGYRRLFRPSALGQAPRATIGVSVICARTDVAADWLARSDDIWHLSPEGAGRGPLLSAEDAHAQPLTDLQVELLAQRRERRVVGAPDRVRASLLRLSQAYGADELVVRTVCHDTGARAESYRLLAEALAPDACPASAPPEPP